MNVYEVEEKLSLRITNIEEEEARLQEWLGFLRRLESIAEAWDRLPSECQLFSATPSGPARDELKLVHPAEESMETAAAERTAEAQSARLSRDGFEVNLQQLRRSVEPQDETQTLQEREFEQLREKLCKRRPNSSVTGRLSTLMSCLMKA